MVSLEWFICCLSTFDLGVGLNSKQRQREDTDRMGCKLHLLPLELLSAIHNTYYTKISQ